MLKYIDNIKVLTHTVPGTGTRFTFEFLHSVLELQRLRRYNNFELNPNFNPNANFYLHFHCLYGRRLFQENNKDKEYQEVLERIKDRRIKIISTLRNPYLSYISLVYNREPRTQEEKEILRLNHIKQWKYYMAAVESYEHRFMDVDVVKGERRKVLKSIIDYIGLEPTDKLESFLSEWAVVGKDKVSAEKEEYLNFGTVHGNTLDFLDFAVEWVENKRREEK
jgi:hypothetical protein